MAANTHTVFSYFQDISKSSKKLLSKCNVCEKTFLGRNISNLKKHLQCRQGYQIMESEEATRITRIRKELNFAIVARGQRCLICNMTFAETSLRSLKNHLLSHRCNELVSGIVFFNIVFKLIDFNRITQQSK